MRSEHDARWRIAVRRRGRRTAFRRRTRRSQRASTAYGHVRGARPCPGCGVRSRRVGSRARGALRAGIDRGRLPSRLGTANRIVPLGDAYLELVTVGDEEEAQTSVFGGWVAQALPAAARPFGWAVRTRRLDDVVERLELAVSSGSRVMRDGSLLRWRLAGIDCAAEEPTLPFFIEWADGTALPGSAPVAHPAGRASIATLRLAGDADRLADWLGPNDLPVTVRAGPPGIATVTLAGAAGEITLDPR